MPKRSNKQEKVNVANGNLLDVDDAVIKRTRMDSKFKVCDQNSAKTSEWTVKDNFIKSKSAEEINAQESLASLNAFYEHAKSLSSDNALDAFSELNNAKLCGYFNRLESKEETKVLFTDLPEMSPICIYSKGRYALWRDNPQDTDILIVHITNDEHFPWIEVVGNKMEHVLYHLGKNNQDLLKKLLPPGCELSRINKEVRKIADQRKKVKLGSLPNDIGIRVPLNGNVGYRKIGMNPSEIKQMLITIGNSDNASLVKHAEEKLTELSAYITMANDECDFGMGLELGHWLWLANYPKLNKKAQQFLSCAYSLLHREEYEIIVKKHFEIRNANAS